MRFLEIFEIFDKTLYFYRGFEKSPKISRKKQKQKSKNLSQIAKNLAKNPKNLAKTSQKKEKKKKNASLLQGIKIIIPCCIPNRVLRLVDTELRIPYSNLNFDVTFFCLKGVGKTSEKSASFFSY